MDLSGTMPADSAVQTLNLERIPLAISMEVAQQYPELAGAKLDAHLDFVQRTMAFKLRRYILALPDQRISHPADWWQALRARWFPSWWLRRHPIRCEEFTVFRAVCPHLKSEEPGACVRWFFTEMNR